MKEQIIEQLQVLIKEDITEEVFFKADELGTEYMKACEQRDHELLDQFIREGGNADDFEAPKDPLDGRFNELVHILNDREKKFKKVRKEEVATKLLAKQQILDDLERLVAKETNIGKAFHKFKELQSKWNELGNIPSRDYKSIQSEYHRHVHNFYYSMKLSKDLKDLDFKRNYEHRTALLSKIESLLQMESIRGVERMLGLYRMEWSELGPTAPETVEELRNKYRDLISHVLQHIKDHQQKREEEEKKNLEEKQALVKQIQQINEEILDNPRQWKERTETIEKILSQWKVIGYATKPDSDIAWKELRDALNKFYINKKEFFIGLKKEYKETKAKKISIIEETEKIVAEKYEDWEEPTNKVIRLQRDWKNAGHIDHGEENRLWKRFREACDKFFNNKKEFLKALDADLYKNLEVKEDLIKRLESFKPSGNAEDDFKILKDFANEWKSIPHVPVNERQRIYEKYKKALDAKYDSMKLEAGEMHLLKFKSTIEMLANSDHSENLIQKERTNIKSRINKLQTTINQYENNLGFFSNSKGMGSLLKDAEENLKKTKDELQMLQQKLKMLNEAASPQTREQVKT